MVVLEGRGLCAREQFDALEHLTVLVSQHPDRGQR